MCKRYGNWPCSTKYFVVAIFTVGTLPHYPQLQCQLFRNLSNELVIFYDSHGHKYVLLWKIDEQKLHLQYLKVKTLKFCDKTNHRNNMGDCEVSTRTKLVPIRAEVMADERDHFSLRARMVGKVAGCECIEVCLFRPFRSLYYGDIF